MHPGKLKSKWHGLNVVKTMYPYGTVEITDKNRISFKVNGQRLKKYYDGHIDTDDKEDFLTRHILLRYDSLGDLYPVTLPSPTPHALLSVSPIIMEYLVKISKKACILELKRRHLKIIVLTSYTPYPSRKIRRICACTSQETMKI
ncbi:hypothetical protein Tco_0853680 [Tanacetum coccineum]